EPPVHQGPEHGAGDGGLAAAAVGPGQQEPRHTFLHIQSPPWLKEKEKARQRSAAAAVFPRRMLPLPHPGKRGARLQAGLLAYGSGRISPALAAPRLPGLPVTGFRQRTPAHPAYSGGTARDSHPVLYSPGGPAARRGTWRFFSHVLYSFPIPLSRRDRIFYQSPGFDSGAKSWYDGR